MKKVLWIACLLCLIPFLGQAQQRAGLMQDPEAAFGQARISKVMPSKIQVRNAKVSGTVPTNFVAHAMYVPKAGDNYGYYYQITWDGTALSFDTIRQYNDWYYSSAEYFEGGPDGYKPVYAFSNDHTVGYSNLTLDDGNATALNSIDVNMNEITYDYNHNRMLGTKYGYIYEIGLGNGTIGEPLYNPYEESADTLTPVAMAADLDGTLYFISLSKKNEDAKLYKFESDDDYLDNPVLVGTLPYPARKIQTMAFNHASKQRELFWWQCDDSGVYHFLWIDKTNASKKYEFTTSQPLTTEFAGLFFEFAYEPHTVFCIDAQDALTVNGARQEDYLPGEDVVIDIDPDQFPCMSIEYMYVLGKADKDTIYSSQVGTNYPGLTIDDVYNEATFAMIATDVEVNAVFVGNKHNITVEKTGGSSACTITTNPSTTGDCGKTITINYSHPEGYMLVEGSLTAKDGNHNNSLTVNSAQYKATFTMPDADVKVKGTYASITVGSLANICQYNKSNNAPSFTTPSTNTGIDEKVIEIFKPGSSSVTATLTPAQFINYEFTIAGVWSYRFKATNDYGVFYTAKKTFTVNPAPRSIAITGNQYNCENGVIELTVVPTPADAVLDGTFTWTKDGVVVTSDSAATMPKFYLNNVLSTDAGIYAVTYESTGGCEMEADDEIMVNVASLPNVPVISIIENEGQNPICYNSSVTLKWEYGYLHPDEYLRQWYTIDATGEWTKINGATDLVCETPVLKDSAYFGLEIRYNGDYNACSNRSDVYVVRVMDPDTVTLAGSNSTCKGIDPVENPYVVGDYSGFIWYFDGKLLGETSNTLHFDDVDLNGNLENVVGIHIITVEAINGTNCNSFGEMEFEVLPLPNTMVTNTLTDDTATWDNEVTIEACAGTPIWLIASGADSYDWGDFNSSNDSILINPTENSIYMCTGTYDTTGCWQTAVVRVNVNPRPEVTWIRPAQDTTFSMMTGSGINHELTLANPADPELLDPFQLVAEPAGGIFTYIIEGDPTNHAYPIDNGILNPYELGIGDYQLVYTYEDANGCTNQENFLKIHVVKPYWTDKGIYDSTWFTNCQAAGRYEISNPHELGAYAAKLNGLYGDPYYFENDTIYITDNINMLEKPYFYRTVNGLKGVFDGNGKIVYNTVLLEDTLNLNIDGTIRNLGVVDAHFESAKVTNYVHVNGDILNSFVTMPYLKNVEPWLPSKGHISNVYYVGKIKGEMSSIWYDNMCTPKRSIMPVTVPELLGNDSTIDLSIFNAGYPEYTYEGELEEWVWLKNDFTYMFWAHDYEGTINHGWPYLTSHFIHHHFVDLVIDDAEVEASLSGVRTRTIKDSTYQYGLSYDVVSVNIADEPYMMIDSVYAELVYPNGTTENANIDETSTGVYSYVLPADILFEPAYDVVFHVAAHRDFWTDTLNYNANWYNDCVAAGRFEITEAADLAALAWECNFNHHNFLGDTIFLTGPSNFQMDMAAHAWEPVYNFQGVIDGRNIIVENLFIASRTPVANEQYAMFVNRHTKGSASEGVIRNFGVKDVTFQKGAENIASLVNGGNMTVYNSFVTYNPTLGQHLDIAVYAETEMVQVINTYTLDEGGNMVTQEGNAIDFADLRAWVANTNSPYYWDWKLDEQPYINYNYPIHSNAWVPGLIITYVPSLQAPVNGYVTGPETALEGETVNVSYYPALGYQLTKLFADTIDILATKSFKMPNHDVTVTAEFTPIEWNYTITYQFESEANPGSGNKLPTPNPEVHQFIYGQIDTLVPPTIEGFEPDPDTLFVEMPNGHVNVTVTYYGKYHEIEFCDFVDVDLATFTTNQPGDSARYTHDVEITITPMDGLSIAIPDDAILFYVDNGITVNEINYRAVRDEGTSRIYTVRMPNGKLIVEACDPSYYTEDYWTDYGIRDITWYIGHESDDVYYLTTDSMLGGFSALVNGLVKATDTVGGLPMFDYSFGDYPAIDFAGKTIIVDKENIPAWQGDHAIDLVEHLWRPIGSQVDDHWLFEGTFDGQGVEITNMKTSEYFAYLGQPGSCQALFGNNGYEGVINNVNIDGIANGRYFTAGIVAINYGLLINSVSHVNVYSEFEAGGIVAVNNGDIYNCYCDADSVECYSARPSKDGAHNYYVGGIAALNEGHIENCHTVATLKYGINGSNPINYYGGAIGVNNMEGDYLYWRNIAKGIGFGIDLTNSQKMTTANYQAITANMNDQAHALNPITAANGEEFALYGWAVETGYSYPVFAEMMSKGILSSNDNELNVVLYPNPTKDIVRIASENINRVTVFNMFGQLILDNEIEGNETTIDLSSFSAGVYTVRIATNEGVAVKNVIVEK